MMPIWRNNGHCEMEKSSPAAVAVVVVAAAAAVAAVVDFFTHTLFFCFETISCGPHTSFFSGNTRLCKCSLALTKVWDLN